MATTVCEPQDYRPFPNVERRNFLQEHLEIPLMVRLLGLEPGGRLLEIGCGRGIALPPFARLLRPARLAAVDIDDALLDAAREGAGRRGIAAEITHADARDLPFDDGSFDLVVDFGTCHHISRPARALREVVRVLRSGGRFVCESVTSQLLSHPWRTRGRRLPWRLAPELVLERDAILWKSRRKVC